MYSTFHIPIYDGVAYEFEINEAMEDTFTFKEKRCIYSGISNYTVEYFEMKMLLVTDVVSATAFSSEMAAISNAMLAVTEKKRMFSHQIICLVILILFLSILYPRGE